MTLPKHHPSDALLLAYATGGLDEGRSLAVAVHLTLCPDCRRRLKLLEAVGGVLLEEVPPDDLPAALIRQTLDRLDDTPQERVTPRPETAAFAGWPAPLRALAGETAQWRTLLPGVRQITLRQRDRSGGSVRLLALSPGLAVPHHRHEGTELTLVLSGSFSDRLGHYGRGDLSELDDDEDHEPVADAGAGCVCLIATEAPLRFTGILPRLAQPWIGL